MYLEGHRDLVTGSRKAEAVSLQACTYPGHRSPAMNQTSERIAAQVRIEAQIQDLKHP
jgi:hypothetical protein